MSMNRAHNALNPHQGEYKHVLCVCSAGLLRSPTAAVVLSQEPYNFNTRAVGLDISHALIALDQVLLLWANEIVCMTKDQEKQLEKRTTKKIICLNIEDDFAYRDPELINRIKTEYDKAAITT